MSLSGNMRAVLRICGGAFFLSLFPMTPVFAQSNSAGGAVSKSQVLDIHFQSTIIGQGVLPFQAAYSGANSLEPHGEFRDTFSFDVSGDLRLWKGGECIADVLSWQGYGLSNTTGVAGFPNGEAFRAGKTYPDAAIGRLYYQQTIGPGRRAANGSPSGSGGGADPDKITLMVGRFGATDIFDKNAYANDARTQFMNWALVSNAAWDYPANTLGFTNGVAAVLALRSWAARAGIFQVSRVANGVRLDWNLLHAWSWAAELERRSSLGGRPGAVRLLAYEERAHMGSFQESLSDPKGIAAEGHLGYRPKYGFGINMGQDICKEFGAFMRLGWNSGKTQTWEFTDVDRTASAGVSFKGKAWRRSGDAAGLAVAVNGIGAVHRQFLAAGGLGITVGDGKLDYGTEGILEAYYSFGTRWNVAVSPDFQFVEHPAYNRDRGPASIYALRLHWEK